LGFIHIQPLNGISVCTTSVVVLALDAATPANLYQHR
jgi:hypothetical protein